MVMADVVLKYIGTGFIPDVPARDLTTDDLGALSEVDHAAAAAHAELVKALPKGAEQPDAPPRRDRRWLQKSGLYEPVDSPAKKE
jgi:hypothetical protein